MSGFHSHCAFWPRRRRHFDASDREHAAASARPVDVRGRGKAGCRWWREWRIDDGLLRTAVTQVTTRSFNLGPASAPPGRCAFAAYGENVSKRDRGQLANA